MEKVSGVKNFARFFDAVQHELIWFSSAHKVYDYIAVRCGGGNFFVTARDTVAWADENLFVFDVFIFPPYKPLN